MTPVTPYLARYAIALGTGAAAATALVTLRPDLYYDLIEARLADLPGGALTPARIVGEGLMAAFVLLIGKEALEALTRERGGLAGRFALVPLAAGAGSLLVATLLWALAAAALGRDPDQDAAFGWALPLGTDVVVAAAFGRLVFGAGHPALQVLLLAAVADDLAGLVLAGLAASGAGLQPVWLVLPVLAAAGGWALLTLPAVSPHATERHRARATRLLPWVALALVSWIGVAMSGLPPVLGALPVLPAMPRPARSFGLFARAEDFLTDPMNRLSRLLHLPLLPVLALFGFTHGGLDPAAAAPASLAVAAAAGLGKPVGFLLGVALARRVLNAPLPVGVDRRDLLHAAILSAACLTVPLLALDGAVPGGAMAEAVRLGLALTALAGPLVLVLAGARRRS
jgi:NhaA family Na+:H+ antiporter